MNDSEDHLLPENKIANFLDFYDYMIVRMHQEGPMFAVIHIYDQIIVALHVIAFTNENYNCCAKFFSVNFLWEKLEHVFEPLLHLLQTFFFPKIISGVWWNSTKYFFGSPPFYTGIISHDGQITSA